MGSYVTCPHSYGGLMNLTTYLEIYDLTQKEFAELVGVSEGAIQNYVKGKRCPTLLIALRIQEKTHDKVTAEELSDYYTEINDGRP